MSDLFDVIEVTLAEPHRVRVLDTMKSERTAEAIVDMAVCRRGVTGRFFMTVKTGTYKDGDRFKPVHS